MMNAESVEFFPFEYANCCDIGPTRHGTTRGETIYASDPSGNRFETFAGGYEPYPDGRTITWTQEGFGHGLDFPNGKLHESFLTIVT